MGLHAVNYVRDFEQDTYYTTKLIQRANDYIQPIIFLHCRSQGSLLSLKVFVQHFFSSVLPNIRREYSLSQISIKIEVCSAFPAVILVFSHSVFSRVKILSLTPKKYIYSRYLWIPCLPINMTFTGKLSKAPN